MMETYLADGILEVFMDDWILSWKNTNRKYTYTYLYIVILIPTNTETKQASDRLAPKNSLKICFMINQRKYISSTHLFN